MRIISASRREDMPAFRMDYLEKKYEEYGEDCFWVLWTKNPKYIIYSGMDFSRVALQLTITGLGGTKLEPGVPDPLKVWDYTEQLINKGFNPKLINWRFDPIVPGYHSRAMVSANAKIAQNLGINRCISSFITWYGQVKERWPEGETTQRDKTQQTKIMTDIKEILARFDIDLYGCTQPHLKDVLKPAACIDGKYYSEITGFEFDTEKDPTQRQHCNCTGSVDIGSYRACAHNCLYCYSKKVTK